MGKRNKILINGQTRKERIERKKEGNNNGGRKEGMKERTRMKK